MFCLFFFKIEFQTLIYNFWTFFSKTEKVGNKIWSSVLRKKRQSVENKIEYTNRWNRWVLMLGWEKKLSFFMMHFKKKVEREMLGKWSKNWNFEKKVESIFFHKMLCLFSTNKVKVTFPEKSRNVWEKVKKYITI